MKYSPRILNIHLYPSSLMHETRIDKIVRSIDGLKKYTQIWVIGINNGGLPSNEVRGGGINYIRITSSNRFNGLIGKIMRFVSYYIETVRMLRKESLGCVNAHSLSVLPLALYLKLIKKCRIVYDTHELETETPSLFGFRKILAKVAELVCIKHVDHVFCVSEPIAEWYENKYSLPRPTVVLNSPETRPLRTSQYLRNKLNLTDGAIIHLYFGLLEPHRGIEQMLDSFSTLELDKFVLVFIGYGSLENLIQNSPGFGRNVFLLPAMHQEDLFDVACSADVGLCLINPTSTSYDYCMPNKLFEYMSAGLPVVVGPCSSLKKFVTENNIGVVAEIMDSKCIADSIRNLDKVLNLNVKAHVYEVFQNYSWQRQLRKLEDVYSTLDQER